MAKQVKIDIVARDKTKQAIDKSKRGLGGLKTAALAVSAALATVGAGRIITNLVNVGKEMESLQVRFKFLFGSVEEGKIAFDGLAKFASKVPFALDDIAMASGNLAVVAKDAKDLTRILEITGNVAAFTGLDFQTTASQIQRAFSGGIAAADIFREKGLRQVLGFSEGAKVSIEDTQKKFEEIFGKGGRLGDVTDALAETFEGTLSMIQDKFLAFKMAVNESFFAELKKQFGDLDAFLAENEENILKFGRDIGKGLASALSETVESVETIVAGFDLFARIIEKADEKTGDYTSQLLFLLEPFKGLEILTGLVAQGNENLTETFNSLIPRVEEAGETISDEQKKFQSLAGIIKEETSPAVQGLEQDVLDLQESLAPLGNAFDAAFSEADKKLAESEANRKRQIENATQNFKDAKFKEIDFEKMSQEEISKMTKQGFRQTLQEASKHSKEMFRLNQALNIAEAIMNTATGVTNALKLGPFGIPLAVAIGAMGAVQIATIAAQQPPAQFGGVRQAGSPFLVGERGPELFTPASAGTVTPAHQLGGAMGATNVTFNINTVDARGFGALLDTRKAQIVNMINSARNQKGQSNIV